MKKSTGAVLAALITAIVGTTAIEAASYNGLSPYIGVRPKNMGVDNRTQIGLRGIHAWDDHNRFRLGIGGSSSKVIATGASKTVLSGEANWLHQILPGSNIRPYGLLGLTWEQIAESNGTRLGGNIGLGSDFMLSRDWALNIEGQFIHFGNNINDQLYTIGLTKYFLPKAKPKPKRVTRKDSDKDGVIDSRDKCPRTSRMAKVDSRGCPVDSDRDGVADYKDKCPKTPRGATIDKHGCMIKVTLGIQFKTGSSVIRPEYNARVQKFARYIKLRNRPIEIQGFTDNVGSKRSNIALSKRRADSVKAALVRLGVPANKIRTVGFGPARPTASNITAEGRAKNRRIDVRVL